MRGHPEKVAAKVMRAAVALLALSALVVGIGSASAAPSKKNYTIQVAVTDDTVSHRAFTVTLQNDPKSNQTFGSVNVTPPAGFTLAVDTAGTTRTGWTAAVVQNVLQLRSTSNPVASGDSVSATVTVSSPTLPTTTCQAGAAWDSAVKQSNDFNGTNNEFTRLGAGTDLTPLGSLSIADIGTFDTRFAPPLFIPQVLTGQQFTASVTASDSCGSPDTDYSGALLDVTPGLDPARMVGSSPALPTTLSWSGGPTTPRVGTVKITPKAVEALDTLTATDSTTKISATSRQFDVVDRLCDTADTTCTWTNKRGTITAASTVPTGNANASLGLGFTPLDATCSLESGAANSFGDGIQISPLNYPDGTYVVVLTYSKSVTGNGRASQFQFCKSVDNGLTWTPIPVCTNSPSPPCAATTRTTGGALQVTLYLLPGDPRTGGFS